MGDPAGRGVGGERIREGAHRRAFVEEVRPEELYVRQVLQGCYRLLRGMVTKCPAMQVPADVSVLHHYRHKRNHQPLASMPPLSPRPQNSESPSPSERTFSAH